MIDLRSDTLTRPTAGMLAAMAAAEVGDEQYREDPTVLELEARVAALAGHAAAVFLPTATMANQIALTLLGERGTQLVAERHTHVLVHEAGGVAANAGLVTRGLQADDGCVTAALLRRAAGEADELQPVGVLVLENTHRSSGGRVFGLDVYRETVAVARELGVAVHLDGARLLNAQVATGTPAAEWGRLADTVTVCFSKALGAPLGAALCGSRELIDRAWRVKLRFGGALRQAGVVAAAALYGLDTNLEEIARDHERAGRLRDGLAAAGLPVAGETNFVEIDLGPLGVSETEAIERLRAAGVLVSGLRPGVLRAVTYLGVTDDDIAAAIPAVAGALGAAVAA